MHCGNVVSNSGTSTDDDIIQVDMDDRSTQCVSVNKGAENVVHHCLECGR